MFSAGDTDVITHFLLTAMVAGIAGTAGMTLLMHLITRSGIANADMVRALGSIFTRSLERAWFLGIVLHFAAGVIFAMLYTITFSFAPREGILTLVTVGAVFGATHGLIVSASLANVVARRHPLKQFQEVDFAAAAAHFAGHVVYGTLVGLVVSLLQFSLP